MSEHPTLNPNDLIAQLPPDCNEREVCSIVVRPVLEQILGYPPNRIREEQTQKEGMRPDFCCYDELGYLDLIVEVKNRGIDLDARPSASASASDAPAGQLKKYLRSLSTSKHGTFGLLTNGDEYRIYQREDDSNGYLSTEKLTSGFYRDPEFNVDIRDCIYKHSVEQPVVTSDQEEEAIQWLEKVAEANSPKSLLVSLRHNLQESIEVWNNNLTAAISLEKTSGDISSSMDGCRYFLTMTIDVDDGILSLADIVESIKTLNLDPDEEFGGIAYARNNNRAVVAMRVFFGVGDQLLSSAMVPPMMPGTLVVNQMTQLVQWVNTGQSEVLRDALNVNALQSAFFDQVAAWFENSTEQTVNDLLHLIRILFAWFLYKHDVIPDTYFEFTPHSPSPEALHNQLMFLFKQVLPIQAEDRGSTGETAVLMDASKRTPFLNGSLFDNDPNLDPTVMQNNVYIHPRYGLFTILDRYEWTLTEHGLLNSDTAIDPSFIGSMYERLIVVAQGIEPHPDARMPDGTYYTPLDITEEMVADALTHAIQTSIPEFETNIGLNLFRSSSKATGVENLSTKLRKAVLKKLREITILDPCVGSGQFIVTTLHAILRAEQRLNHGSQIQSKERIRHALQHQLYGADIHPIAVQITRFRFYLSLVQQHLIRDELVQPLPNLETRILCVNSLATQIEQYDDIFTLAPYQDRLRELSHIRERYVMTFSLSAKKHLVDEERKVKTELLDLILPDSQTGLYDWLHSDIGEAITFPLQINLQRLFLMEKGWHVVIGNPPYQKLSITKGLQERLRQSGYRSTSANDAYTVFVELALKLARKPLGVVTMIVPNSICYARTKRSLRSVCEQQAREIYLRSYNNRPNSIFPPHPFVKGGTRSAENVQRTSVCTFILDDPAKKVSAPRYASSYNFIPKEERSNVLAKRQSVQQSNYSQWTMAGTSELVSLLEKMYDESASKPKLGRGSKTLTFPNTAGYFLTCLPKGKIKNHTWKQFIVPNDDVYYARIALYNSQVFHAYWLMIGDAFNVQHNQFEKCKLPISWDKNCKFLQEASSIGKEFCAPRTLNKCRTQIKKVGKVFKNYNFQQGVPSLVATADEVVLRSYGFRGQVLSSLRNQVKLLRTGEIWRLAD